MPTFGQPVPAIRGKFGQKIECYQTTIPARDFKAVLGHDPRSKNWHSLSKSDGETFALYDYLQRKTDKKRRDNLKEYIKYRMGPNPFVPGAFPAVSIGVLEPGRFEPYARPADQDVGILYLPTSPRVLLDGLGRVSAALDLIEEDKQVGDWFTFPVTIYLPAPNQTITKEELGQLFHDFNFRQVRVAENMAMSLDTSDLHIRMTKLLGEAGAIGRNGGMDNTASLGGNSSAMVVQKHLLKFVRGALEGRDAQDSQKDRVEHPNLTQASFEAYRRKLEAFLGFLEMHMPDGQFANRENVHLSSGGWQVLGIIFNDVEFRLAGKLSVTEKEHIYKRLAAIDWSRYNEFWIGTLGEAEVGADGKRRLGKSTKWGRTVKEQLLAYVREECGIADLLSANDPVAELTSAV